jgi:predicted O-methyltransferase YrrM
MKPYRTGDHEAGLRDFARRAGKHIGGGANILEIGSFVGDSTRIFIEEIKPRAVFCVDPWDEQMPGYTVEDGDIRQAFADNVEKTAATHGCRIVPVQMRSGDYFRSGIAVAREFDLVYIDAVHTREAVADDILGVIGSLKRGGILAGHDYCPRRFIGVVEAVDHALRHFAGRFSHLELYRDTSWALMPREAGEG